MGKSVVIGFGLVALVSMRCQSGGGTPPSKPAVPAAAAAEAPPPPPAERSKLVEMLRDPLLWGPDYPAALGALPAFLRAGESKVDLQQRRVVGHRKYTAPAEAEHVAATADEALKAAPPPLRIMLPNGDAQPHALSRISAVLLPDDRALHVGTPDQPAQYIATNVRIDQVQERFGKPDRVTVEVIDDGSERRPIELTLYHYANDAIIVATADVNADPRAVDRVILDTKAVMQAIY